MASYNELNALIDAYINRNGVQAITGQILNGVLKAMVEQLGRGYTIMGAAIPTTDPGTPDGPECYFASETGTYTDFDGLQVAPGELALLCYTPSDGWTKATIYEGFQEVGATIDGNVGTPSVGVSYAGGVLSFDFHDMKGNPGQNGQDGAAAGFGTIGADITGGVGTPGVTVESSGPATAKNLQFHFTNLKGETGVTSVVATVDNTTGNPACTVSLVGQQLTLAFSGLKGAQGDTGSSVDYPFTIVNNLTTNDATKGLSAAQGVVLAGQVSQLEAELIKTLVREITKVDDLSNLVGQDGKYVDRDGQVQSYATYAISIPFSMLKGDVIKVFGMESSGTATLAKVESGVYTPVYSANIIKQQTFVYEAEEDEDIVVSFSKSLATGAYISVERLDGYEDYPLADKSLNNGANYIDVSGLGMSGKIVLDFGTLQSTGNIYVGYSDSQSEPAQTSRYRIPGTNTPPVSVISPDSTTYIYVFTDFSANLKIYQGGTIERIPSLEQGKQNKLTFDDVPTEGSENPVKSGGIKDAISFITSKSNYQEGKYVNFQGLDMDAPEWGLSEIIAYVPGSAVVWNYGAGNAVSTRCLVFLDSAKRFIANAYWSANDASGVRTISASEVSQYAPGAAYIKASFRLSTETPFVQVGSDKWIPKNGGDLEPSIIKKVNDNSFGNVYCEDVVIEKQMAFCGLFADAGKVDSFVFMTDPHLMGVNNTFDENGTFRPFLAVLQKFYKSIPASFMLCGGDWLNSGDYKSIAAWKLGVVDSTMRKLFGADYRPVLGNHDTNYQGYVSESDDSAGTLSHDACVSVLFNREGNTYYDFVTPNCHYYVLDTGLDRTLQMTSEQWAQIDWLGDKLAENTKDNVAIVMHEYSNAGDASQWTQKLFAIGTNVQLLMTAFNAKSSVTLNGVTYDFSNATGTCRFIICGHSHFDHIDTDGNIPVICSTNFTSGGVPTFDLVFVDFTAGVLKTVRIGAGKNRTMELS